MNRNSSDIVVRYYQALFSKNLTAVMALLDPKIVHEFNQEFPEVGPAIFEEFLLKKFSHYNETIQKIDVISEGAKASAFLQIKGSYNATYPGLPPATGQLYELNVYAFFEFNGNLISKISTFFNLGSFLRQISSSELLESCDT